MKKNILPHIPFYFIRHGQTDWNKSRTAMGQTDIPLNEVGIMQAQNAAKDVAHLDISHIISSPLQRAKQTSEIIAATMQKNILYASGLIECSWGIMEGQPKGNGEWLEYWKTGGNIKDAEHCFDFSHRITTSLSDILNEHASKKPILIVSHGGVYWALNRILTIPAISDIQNCGLYFFRPPDAHSAQWSVRALQTEKEPLV